MNNNDTPDQPLSDDPEENMRMENELLKLKLQAELGGQSHSFSNIPPEIENEFLKNVLAFEQNFANSEPVKVYDLLGKPDFKRSDELSDGQLDGALQQVIGLLAEKDIEVYFGDDDEYDSRTQYQFITEELFAHETSFVMPGMTTHFDYEEFHPNHKKDIENLALKFLSAWLEKDLEACGRELSHHSILPDKTVLSKAGVLAQIERVFEAYTSFNLDKQGIFDVGFSLEAGMGHVEGGLKYRAVLENGDSVGFGGPFKLYFSYEREYWSIVYMVLPGFNYF